MSKDFGSAGTSAPHPTFDPLEAGTPVVGFTDAPKGSIHNTEVGPGVGGSNPGFKG